MAPSWKWPGGVGRCAVGGSRELNLSIGERFTAPGVHNGTADFPSLRGGRPEQQRGRQYERFTCYTIIAQMHLWKTWFTIFGCET